MTTTTAGDGAPSLTALCLTAGGEQWAIPARHVGRTVAATLGPMAGGGWVRQPSPAHGAIQVAIDLAGWWALPASPADTVAPESTPTYIILPAAEVGVGLAVREIGGLRHLPLAEIQPVPALLRATLGARGCWGIIPPTTERPEPLWLLDLWALLRAAVGQFAVLESHP